LGIIERQKRGAKDHSQKQMPVQLSKRKDQDVGGRGIMIERQKHRVVRGGASHDPGPKGDTFDMD
jgi:hypothetical protein